MVITHKKWLLICQRIFLDEHCMHNVRGEGDIQNKIP